MKRFLIIVGICMPITVDASMLWYSVGRNSGKRACSCRIEKQRIQELERQNQELQAEIRVLRLHRTKHKDQK